MFRIESPFDRPLSTGKRNALNLAQRAKIGLNRVREEISTALHVHAKRYFVQTRLIGQLLPQRSRVTAARRHVRLAAVANTAPNTVADTAAGIRTDIQLPHWPQFREGILTRVADELALVDRHERSHQPPIEQSWPMNIDPVGKRFRQRAVHVAIDIGHPICGYAIDIAPCQNVSTQLRQHVVRDRLRLACRIATRSLAPSTQNRRFPRLVEQDVAADRLPQTIVLRQDRRTGRYQAVRVERERALL